jgi:electron transfer flavoprotein alpha subunit
MDMANVLAFAEHKDGHVGAAGREAIATAARLAAELGGVAHALVIGAPGTSERVGTLGASGAHSVTVAEHASLAEYHPDAYSIVIAEHVRGGSYAAVILPATTLGKDLAPRVAARLDVPLASDATAIETHDGVFSVIRPVYSGKAFARVTLDASPALITIRPNVFSAEAPAGAGTVEAITPTVDIQSAGLRVVQRLGADGSATDVAEASVVVSGGRGLKEPEHWQLLEGLRDALGEGVALGASRAVVDAGWRPHGEQVGQTGKTVAPKLYFAIGISGAIQHLAGMRTSQTIVAINKDPDAPIFGVADYGVVGDLFEIVPRLTQEIAALKAAD